MVPRIQLRGRQNQEDPVNRHRDGHVRPQIRVSLVVAVQEVVGLERTWKRVKAWTRQGRFSEGIP